MTAPKVFVHGNPETAVVWERLVAELRRRGVVRMHCVSPPAFGAPVPAGFGCTQSEYRDWLIGELEAFGEPVDLVGHDWGAGHTYAVAAARPDLLRTWAADCGGMLHPDYVWHHAAQMWLTPGLGEQAVAVMTALEPDVVAGSWHVDAELAERLTAHLDEQMGAAILALYRSAAQPALSELGDRLAAAERRPALMIAPTADPYVPSELAVAVAERLGAQLVHLDGQAHWWMWDAPVAAADALTTLWSNH